MDRRSSVLILKAIINLAVPIYPLVKLEKKEPIPIILGIILFLIAPIGIFYINHRKRLYKEKFIRKIYIPSNKVFITLFACELLAIPAFYIYIEKYGYLGIVHGALALLPYIYVYVKYSREQIRVNSFPSSFKLAIMERDIGTGNGLSQGEVVKIRETTSTGYVVVNHKSQEFTILKEDVAQIIDMV
ncbi:hypothetical protein ENBRE01_3231 [Enteropsectra breve]|nr:hypothetical protein ENBRE01_3231 [Enteropsectra breve]